MGISIDVSVDKDGANPRLLIRGFGEKDHQLLGRVSKAVGDTGANCIIVKFHDGDEKALIIPLPVPTGDEDIAIFGLEPMEANHEPSP